MMITMIEIVVFTTKRVRKLAVSMDVTVKVTITAATTTTTTIDCDYRSTE